jgi:CheY-like chemotaxis protein
MGEATPCGRGYATLGCVSVGQARVRVLVVDDDPNFVEAAAALLGADKRLEVVGGAHGGEEAVRQARLVEPDGSRWMS